MSNPHYGPQFNPSPAILTGLYANPANRGVPLDQLEAKMLHPSSWDQALADPSMAHMSDAEKTGYLRGTYGLGSDYEVANGQLEPTGNWLTHNLWWLAPAAMVGGPALAGLFSGGAEAGAAAGGAAGAGEAGAAGAGAAGTGAAIDVGELTPGAFGSATLPSALTSTASTAPIAGGAGMDFGLGDILGLVKQFGIPGTGDGGSDPGTDGTDGGGSDLGGILHTITGFLGKLKSAGIDPTLLGLGGLSAAFHAPYHQAYTGPNTNPEDLLNSAVTGIHDLAGQIASNVPHLRSVLPTAPAPVSIPGLPFQIGAGLNGAPSGMDNGAPLPSPNLTNPIKLRQPNAPGA